MRLPLTLSKYIMKHFFLNMLIVFSTFAVIILLLDTLELIRRASNKDVPIWVLIQMALLKFPLMGQKIIPFATLVGAVLSYTKLTKHNEIAVIRSAGVSIWEFLLPSIASAFFLGLLMILVLNPLSTAMLSQYERIEGKYFHGKTSFLALSSSGLWLRQKNYVLNDRDTGIKWGETVIHAKALEEKEEIILYDVLIFKFNEKGGFDLRIDAKSAALLSGFWQLKDAIITSTDSLTKKHEEYFLETDMTLKDIHNSFASPRTISFWELPEFIETLKKSGFSATPHRLYWHKTLASPMLYAAMIFIAAIFSLRPTRQGRTGLLITGSILTGFFIYFLTDLVSSFGLSGSVPVIFAAWSPVLMIMLTGIGLLLHFEDG